MSKLTKLCRTKFKKRKHIESEEPNPNRKRHDLTIKTNTKMEESERCACCFTLKGVVTSSIVILVFVGILVFTLDFTILEHEREYRLKMWSSDGFRTVIEQDGEKFEEKNVYNNYDHLRTLNLSNVEANISTIVEFIHYSTQLEVLRLVNMNFVGKLPKYIRGSAYRFYSLKEFTLDFNVDMGPDKHFQLDPCDACLYNSEDRDIKDIRQRTCLKSLMLFIMQEDEYATKILGPNLAETEIRISLGGWKLLTILPKEGEVSIMFEDCEEILQNILDNFSEFKFKKLALNGCRNLTVQTLKEVYRKGGPLTHLVLDTVSFEELSPGFRISRIFENMETLEELVIKVGSLSTVRPSRPLSFKQILISNLPPSSPAPAPIEVDLSDFPKSLKKLTLVHTNILTNSTNQLNHLSLDTLAIKVVSVGKKLQDIILNLEYRKIGLGLPPTTDQLERIDFLNKILEKRYTEWILLPNFMTPGFTYGIRMQSNRALVLWLASKGCKIVGATAFVITRRGETKWQCERELLTSSDELNYWFDFLNMENFIHKNSEEMLVW